MFKKNNTSLKPDAQKVKFSRGHETLKREKSTTPMTSDFYTFGFENSTTPISLSDITKEQAMLYLRGVYDRSGVLIDNHLYLKAGGEDHCNNIRQILNFLNLQHSISTEDSNIIKLSLINACDFIGHIYTPGCEFKLTRKYKESVAFLKGDPNSIPKCQIVRSPGGFLPQKDRPTDDGYDIAIIADEGPLGPLNDPTIRIYTTNISVIPDRGWHVEIVARSSLIKYGYLLPSVGIIDSCYTGKIKIVLKKISAESKPIEFPFWGCQMLLRPNVHYNIEEVDRHQLDHTSRGMGGLGSTKR